MQDQADLEASGYVAEYLHNSEEQALTAMKLCIKQLPKPNYISEVRQASVHWDQLQGHL